MPLSGRCVALADPSLLEGPVNVLRLSLHPKGLAHAIVNWHEWRAHLLARVRRQVEVSGDATLGALLRNWRRIRRPRMPVPPGHGEIDAVVVPFQLRTPSGVLSFFSTTTVFGTPVDITLSELAIEAFFPADAQTADALRLMVGA